MGALFNNRFWEELIYSVYERTCTVRMGSDPYLTQVVYVVCRVDRGTPQGGYGVCEVRGIEQIVTQS